MIDYSTLGFKSGLEIHQRLDCRKLFCECYCNPGAVEETQVKNAARLERFFRPVESETGAIDPTAAFEASKQKKIVYYAPRESSCLVECDEEPPHALNRQALETVLRVAHALNARVVDEVHVMRKQVLDGSAVAGFQRTCLIAVGGYLETSKGRVGIQSICLEEESAGIIQQGEGETVYSLDRLGIPLIEIATEPTLADAEHVRETAQKIGALLRSAGGVQRGIGSIRQDLNISIAGGARVEVKGAQELDAVKKIVENEVLRQQKLIELKKKLAKALPEGKQIKSTEPIDATGVFSEKTGFVFKSKLNNDVKCLGVRLAGFAGLLKTELMPDHRFGTELSGYVQAATGLRGIIHSDEDLSKYKISSEERKTLEKKLGVRDSGDALDAFVLVIGPEAQAKQAIKILLERVKQAFMGVPNETRKASGEKAVFLRPLPGSARMYPETDVAAIKITHGLLEKASEKIESAEEKASRFQKFGLSPQVASKMSVANPQQIEWFEKIAKKYPAQSTYAAVILLESMTAFKRSGLAVEKVTLTHLLELFDLLEKNKIAKPAVEEALKYLAQNPSKTAVQTVDEKKLWKKTKREMHELAKSGKAFGELMREHRLTVDAQELQEALEGLKEGKQN